MKPTKSTMEIMNELVRILNSMPKDSEYRKELEQTIKQLIDEDKIKNGNGGLA